MAGSTERGLGSCLWHQAQTTTFDVGRAIVRRDVQGGKVASVWLGRVVDDPGDDLVWAVFPGVEMLSRAPYVEALRTGVKAHHLDELAAGEWTLASAPLESGTILVFQLRNTYFSVMLFFKENGEFRRWYVNFERPYRRTSIGFDTSDLLVDLVIEPDGAYRWKDEEEYEQGRRLGLVSDTDHVRVKEAREQALAMVEQRLGPFEERGSTGGGIRPGLCPRCPPMPRACRPSTRGRREQRHTSADRTDLPGHREQADKSHAV